MDRKITALFESEISEIRQGQDLGILPKGGPKQSSWGDFRDEVTGFNVVGSINIIEVGILDIPNSVFKTGT
jgi:hypothetical protein